MMFCNQNILKKREKREKREKSESGMIQELPECKDARKQNCKIGSNRTTEDLHTFTKWRQKFKTTCTRSAWNGTTT